VILAGDHKQLGPVVRSSLAGQHGLQLSYLERLGQRSLYLPERQSGLDGNDPPPSPPSPGGAETQEAAGDGARRGRGGVDALGYDRRVITKLVRNYRSHPDILSLPNRLFYEGHLQASADPARSHSHKDWEHLPAPGFPLIFHGVEGKNERESNSPSWFNVAECSQVLEYVKRLLSQGNRHTLQPKEIGIVTPYAKQVEKLTLLLRKNGIKVGPSNSDAVMIGTAEKFQGQERRVILVSTVRSSESFLEFDAKHNLGFVANPKRFNVAVTRAQVFFTAVRSGRRVRGLDLGCTCLERVDFSWGRSGGVLW
jgi:helicase MOV-10